MHRSRAKSLCVVFLAVLGSFAVAHAGVVRVPQDQATISQGVAAAQPGDVVRVSAGTYADTVDITSRNDLTIEAKGKVVLDATGHDVAIAIHDADRITIRGLDIRGAATSGIVANDCSGLSIERCRVRDSADVSISVTAARASRIERCKSLGAETGFDVAGVGVRVVACRAREANALGFRLGGTDCVMESCRATRCGTGFQLVAAGSCLLTACRCDEIHANGVALGDDTGDSVIRGCRIRDVGGFGIDLEQDALHCVIESNEIAGSGLSGIHVAGDESTIRRNVLTSCGADGIECDPSTAARDLLLENKIRNPAHAGVRLAGELVTSIFDRVKGAPDGRIVKEVDAPVVIVVEPPKGKPPATIRVPQDHATVQEAIDVAQPGDVIEVAAGTYPGNVDLTGVAGVVLRARGKVVLQPTATVTLSAAFDTRVIGFTIESASSLAVRIQKSNGAALIDCDVRPGPATALFVASSDVVVDRCELGGKVRLLGNAIVLRGSDVFGAQGNAVEIVAVQSIVEDCELRDATGNGVDLSTTSDSLFANAITGNKLRNVSAGVVVETPAPVLLVEKNKFVGGANGGVVLTDSADAVMVIDNKMLDSVAAGVSSAGKFSVIAFNRVVGGQLGIALGASAAFALANGNVLTNSAVAAIELAGQDNAVIANRSTGAIGAGFSELSVGENILLDNVVQP